MNGHHPSTEQRQLPMFPALSMLERKPEYMPLHHGREPFWRAPITPPSHDVLIPSWAWASPHQVPEDAVLLSLDVNGSYLSAAGGVTIAHSELAHLGAPRVELRPRDVLPGYYRIIRPHWAFSGTIVSPLGDSSRLETEDTLWVSHPTLVLLLELAEANAITYPEILDAWVARTTTHFRKWCAGLREVRDELLDALAQCQTDAASEAILSKYARFKEGYSVAFSMMLTGENNRARRPDWAHAVHAQHAASTWRKAWRWTETGRPLVALGAVDEITVLAEDLPHVMSRPKPPFRYDDTGRTLGALKTKPKPTPPTTATPLALADTTGDVL